MSEIAPTGHPFHEDNRAWRRLADLLGEHFDVVRWDHADTGRPVMTTLLDLASGDAVTLAVIDSAENDQPHILLAATGHGALAGHGPFDSASAADSYAGQLAMTDPAVAATRAVPLYQPDRELPPRQAWLALPFDLAALAQPATTRTPGAVMVLLDRFGARFVAVGPWPDPAAARRAAPLVDPGVDRLVLPLHPPAAADPPPDQ
jgi:hypothetical protein